MTDDTDGPPERSTGARVLRIALIAVLIAVVVVVLFTTVFPWVEERTQVPTIGAVAWPIATGLVS